MRTGNCLGGATDFLVHVVCRDTEHLRLLTRRAFMNRTEVSRIETSLVYSFARSNVSVEPEEAPPKPVKRKRRR
ncbi:MAG: Lrp/AsnC ligand binding domain-containing protein [Kofleriaceae bacterium]